MRRGKRKRRWGRKGERRKRGGGGGEKEVKGKRRGGGEKEKVELDVLEETKFLWSGQQETREVCVVCGDACCVNSEEGICGWGQVTTVR